MLHPRIFDIIAERCSGVTTSKIRASKPSCNVLGGLSQGFGALAQQAGGWSCPGVWCKSFALYAVSGGSGRLAAARLMTVAAASRLSPATRGSQNSYTTPGDTTRRLSRGGSLARGKGLRCVAKLLAGFAPMLLLLASTAVSQTVTASASQSRSDRSTAVHLPHHRHRFGLVLEMDETRRECRALAELCRRPEMSDAVAPDEFG